MQKLVDSGIEAALQAPFRIYDEDGALVASGVVDGAAIEVPIGTYRVEVRSDPPVTFDPVEVGPGAAIQLTVGG